MHLFHTQKISKMQHVITTNKQWNPFQIKSQLKRFIGCNFSFACTAFNLYIGESPAIAIANGVRNERTFFSHIHSSILLSDEWLTKGANSSWLNFEEVFLFLGEFKGSNRGKSNTKPMNYEYFITFLKKSLCRWYDIHWCQVESESKFLWDWNRFRVEKSIFGLAEMVKAVLACGKKYICGQYIDQDSLWMISMWLEFNRRIVFAHFAFH